jgi:excisionase family DNA binding protein
MEVSDDKYTMGVGDAAKLLGVSRETVHNYIDSGELSYRTRPHGQQRWKYLYPDEVQALARKLSGEVNT